MIEIRRAKKRDLPHVLELVKELAVFENEPDAVTATIQDYNKAFESQLIDLLIAEYKGVIAGMALFYDTFNTWKGKMLYLEDFVVKSEFRNKKIGEKLFNQLLELAKQKKCKLIKWQVLDWNVNAVRFYERYNCEIDKEWWNCKILFEDE